MTSTDQPESVPAYTYFVALVEDGVPKFSSNPVAHDDRETAKREADRLAAANPGKLFQLFLSSRRVEPSYVAPKPAITGRWLQTEAPPGVYKGCVGASRFVVVENEDARAVLFCANGRVSLMHPTNWNDVAFEFTDEPVSRYLG